VDEAQILEAIAIDETTGRIAVSAGADVFIYHPYGIKDESLKVRAFWTAWLERYLFPQLQRIYNPLNNRD
jgi:hypothetical protein